MADSNTAESQGQTTGDTGKKVKILLADDSKLVRVTAEKILGSQFDLILAEDGEEAWEKITSDSTIQVIFTDLGMPRLDGYDLIQRIRQSEEEAIRNQPIIVLTGAAEEEDVRRKVFDIGATDFITKPFKSTEIIARAEAHANYRQDKEHLQKNVDMDLLTSTLNKKGVTEQLEKDVSFVNRHGANLALITFELDDFNSVYETVGKQNAERIIQQAAKSLVNTIRKEDSIGRLGLAQFAVILPMAKTEGVISLTKRLCEQVGRFKMSIGGKPLPITMSAGIAAVKKGEPATADDLFNTAEQALGNAKALGKGEVQILKLESGAEETEDEDTPSVSVDSLLEAIERGQTDSAMEQLDHVVRRLMPLTALMTKEQKQRLLDQ